MSILLIRTIAKFRPNHSIHSMVKLTTRSFGITPTVQQKQKVQNDSSVTTSNASDRTDVSTDVRPIGERIKENTKTASYFGVIVFGIGVTGVIMFVVFRELFSSSSPNNVYSEALTRCINVSWNFTFDSNTIHCILTIASHLIAGYSHPRCYRKSDKRFWWRKSSKTSSTRSPFNLWAKWQAIHTNAVLCSGNSKQGNGSFRKGIGLYLLLNTIKNAYKLTSAINSIDFSFASGFESISLFVRAAWLLSARDNHFRGQSFGYRRSGRNTVIGQPKVLIVWRCIIKMCWICSEAFSFCSSDQ